MLEFIPRLDIDNISLLVPSNAENIKTDALLFILSNFDSVTKRLPVTSTTLADVQIFVRCYHLSFREK